MNSGSIYEVLRTLAICLGPILAVQAQALSCLPWQVEHAFDEADASAEPYVIVTGRLDFAAADLPQVDWNRQQDVPPVTRAEARLAGSIMGRAGASTRFDEPVQLIVECSGPWCPQLAPGAKYLAFVNIAEQPYVLRIGPCGGMLFQDPGPPMLARVEACLDGADCTPPER